MDDGDHEGLRTSFHSDPRFLVATTVATLVVAGSTYIWRSNPRRLFGDLHQRGETVHKAYDATGIADDQSAVQETSKSEESSSQDTVYGPAQAVNDDLSNQADARDAKSSRSKERRRRGKDPLKELLKGGKKYKILTKSFKAEEADGDGVGPSDNLPAIQESTSSHHAREQSLAPSSRSMSTASTSNCTTPPPNPDWAGPYPNPKQGAPESDDADATTFSNPAVSNASHSSPQKQMIPDSLTSVHSLHPDPLTHPQSPESTNSCPSTSSSISNSSSIFSSESSITTSTSPTLSLFDKTPTLVPVERFSCLSPRSPTNLVTPFLPPVQKDQGPRTWDAPPSSSISDNTPQKPPRFRSKSRPSTPASNMIAASDSESTLLHSSSGQRDNDSHPFTFPTLNPSSGPDWNQSNRAANHTTSNGNGVISIGNGHSNGTTSKHTTTPRRPNALPSGTNIPPLPSTTPPATQLASMRGALEAARLREEKSKFEIERSSQELEMMRRETANWRRREMELQHQIRHLMHQVQTYATLLTSVTAQTSPISQQQHHNGAEPHSAQNGYQFTPPPGPHSPPPHLHIPQMFLSNGIPNVLSPMSLAHSPHSPFYPYPSHSPHPHQQHGHPHVPAQPKQSPHQQSNMLSMLLPQVVSASESEPSSVAGSSAGSHSPDLAGSPTLSHALFDRGRRRTRARTQTIDVRTDQHSDNGTGGGESGDGWIGIGDEGDLGDDSEHDSGEGSFSGVLADAILKRPDSIRGLSSKRGKFKETAPAEFTFPSLSEMGNVSRGHSWSAELPSSDEKEDEVAEGIKQDVVETMLETTPLASVETDPK